MYRCFAAKPDVLSSIPRTHEVEEENPNSQKLPSDLPIQTFMFAPILFLPRGSLLCGFRDHTLFPAVSPSPLGDSSNVCHVTNGQKGSATSSLA